MLTLILLSVFAVTADDGLAAMIPRVEHAMTVGSVEQLEKCRETLLQEAGHASGDQANLLRYTQAYVDWRLYPLLAYGPKADKGRGLAYLEEAERLLKELVQADPANAEAHALLSTVYGQEISANPWKAMLLGPRSSASIETARKLAGDNPRVVLLAGAGLLFTPRMFGGGSDKAEKELRRAEALFQMQAADAPWPNWGQLDVLAWMGQVLAAKGDRQGARAYYERALSLQPDYGWVRRALLPALDKAALDKPPAKR